MIKNKKIINILMASILFITFNFLFILNGCTTSNSTGAVVEETQSVVLNEVDVSANNDSEATVSEDSAEEKDTSENENNNQANDTVDEKEQEDPNSLKSIYQRFIESGKPSILIFSYDADCCATTKAFFDNYNGMAKKLLEEYSGKFNTLFINTGILDKNNMNTVVEIASQNKVLNLPSILILDKTGKNYKVIEGLFDEAEAKKVLDGMLK